MKTFTLCENFEKGLITEVSVFTNIFMNSHSK